MKFIISTTNSLEYYKVEKYYGIVTAHVVTGTGFFSDLAASFTDVLGGRSESYQKQLVSIKEEVLYKIQKNATLLGANGILGFKLDFDEISGKAKSMFMVTGIGTAVKLDALNLEAHFSNDDKIILGEDFELVMKRNDIIKKINQDEQYPDSQTWSFIISNKIVDVLDTLCKKFVYVHNEKEKVDSVFKAEYYSKFKEYLVSISIPEYIDKVYSLLSINNKHLDGLILEVIKKSGNTNYDIIISVVVQNKLKPKILPDLVSLTSAMYNKEDIAKISIITKYISENYIKTSQPFEKKALLSNKIDNYWICENGHKNQEGNIHCWTCQIDEFGYGSGEINPNEAVISLNKKIDILKECFGIST